MGPGDFIQLAAHMTLSVIVVGIAIAALRNSQKAFERNLTMAIETMKKDLELTSNHIQQHCATVSGHMCGQIDRLEKTHAKRLDAIEEDRAQCAKEGSHAVENLYNRIHVHGHKGLQGEDAKVTLE